MTDKLATSKAATLAMLLTASLLILGPLLRSGKNGLAFLTLESIGLTLLFIMLWNNLHHHKLHRPMAAYLVTGLIFACFYLLPIPFSLWQQLPGREIYVEVFGWLAAQDIAITHHSLSIIRFETILSLLSLLAPLAVFLAAISLNKKQIQFLIYVFLAGAAFQAALGLIQFASGNPLFYFGIPANGQSAQGTYLNRDHFAALMEMAIPIAIAISIYSLSIYRQQHRDAHPVSINRSLLFASLAILIILGGIFSRSRSGVFLTLVAILISSVVFARQLGHKKSGGFTGLIASLAIGIAMSIGVMPIISRFINEDHLSDERWNIFSHTIDGIKSFFPFGSGPGTYPDIYRLFQPLEQQMFINHAHNDYLELMFEMGIFGMLIIIAYFMLYIYGWRKLWKQYHWDHMHFIQVAAGIGLFLILLHSLVDFNLHTPANAITFGFLNGLFFRKAHHHSRRKHRKHRSHELPSTPA